LLLAFCFCGEGKRSKKEVVNCLGRLDYLVTTKLCEKGGRGEEMKIKLGRIFPRVGDPLPAKE
jgi:hypothetical protein